MLSLHARLVASAIVTSFWVLPASAGVVHVSPTPLLDTPPILRAKIVSRASDKVFSGAPGSPPVAITEETAAYSGNWSIDVDVSTEARHAVNERKGTAKLTVTHLTPPDPHPAHGTPFVFETNFDLTAPPLGAFVILDSKAEALPHSADHLDSFVAKLQLHFFNTGSITTLEQWRYNVTATHPAPVPASLPVAAALMAFAGVRMYRRERRREAG